MCSELEAWLVTSKGRMVMVVVVAVVLTADSQIVCCLTHCSQSALCGTARYRAHVSVCLPSSSERKVESS